MKTLGIANAGKFHPTKAPLKQRASKIPVLLTAPSKVIRLVVSTVDEDVLNPLAVFMSLDD